MRSNLFSIKALYITMLLFLVGSVQSLAIPWSPDSWQGSIQAQHYQMLNTKVFTGSYSEASFKTTTFNPNVEVVVFEENFDSGTLPAGWSVQMDGVDASSEIGDCEDAIFSFNCTSDPFFGGLNSNFSGNFAVIDDDYAFFEESIKTVTSPVIDLSTYSSPKTFSFAWTFTYIFSSGLVDHMDLEVWNGSSWDVIFSTCCSDSNGYEEIDISSYNNSDFQFRFLLDDADDWVYGGGFDSIKITADDSGGSTGDACFTEDFSDITAGNSTTTNGSGTAWNGNTNFPTVDRAYQAGGAVKLGTGSFIGSIESRDLDEVEGDITVNISVKGWTNVEGDLKVSIDGQEETLSYTAKMADDFETVSATFSGVASGSNLKIETTAKRAFIDGVEIICDEDTGGGNNEGCLDAPNGQFPGQTFTPLCLGEPEAITSFGWTGEYSKVNLTAGEEYTFSSSESTDYVTISDEDGTTVLAFGTTPVVYTADTTGVVRFYIHLDEDCSTDSSFRSRLVQCGTPVVIEEPAYDCVKGDGIAEVDDAYPINDPSYVIVADDFIVDEGIEFTIWEITVDTNQPEIPTTATLNIREDNGGQPGAVIETVTMAPSGSVMYGTAFGDPIYHMTFELITPIVLGEGTYYLQPEMSVPSQTEVWWALTESGLTGGSVMYSIDGGSSWLSEPGYDAIFFVAGECAVADDPEPNDACFTEDFSDITAGDNTTTGGSGSAWNGNANFPTVDRAYQAGGAVKLGTGSFIGSIESRDLDEVEGDITVNISVKGWTNVEGDLKVSIDGQEETLSYTAKMADDFETVSATFSGVASGSNLKIETTAKRAFIDGVEIICDEDPGGGNNEDCDQGDDSNDIENGYNITEGSSYRNADDFFVSSGNTLNIKQIEINVLSQVQFTSMDFTFYEDDGGLPGTVVETLTGVPVETAAIGADFGYTLYAAFADVDLNFTEGHYWMQPVVNGGSVAFWEVTSAGTLGEYIVTSESNGPWISDEDMSHGVFKLHCEPVDIPEDQCLFAITSSVEPITRVVLSDIDNSSSPVVNGSPELEDFTSIVGHLAPGTTYEAAFEGNTNGPYTNYFTVWIDFDQSGTYDIDEMFQIGSIFGSNGQDGQQATGDIVVPADATGVTTMRVIKNFGSFAENPCGQYSYGQAEDYTIEFADLEDCDGTPEGGTVTVNPAQGNPGSTYVVSASGYTIGNGLTYQWQSNTDGAAWVNEGTATSTYESYTATAPAEIGTEVDWRLEVTCTNSSETSHSTEATFTVEKVYCDPDVLIVEPITRVVFADIDNTSSATSTLPYEDFTAIIGDITIGLEYEIALEGNTAGAFTNYFTVWIDWNQNGTFETDEMYEIGSIYNSTGTDGQQAVNQILVPADAAIGPTRMRVIKNFGSSPDDPCGSYLFGQVEDYTVNVETLGVKDISNSDFAYWPNPVSDMLNISAANKVESVAVFNLTGQSLVRDAKVVNGQIDLSTLTTGTYIIRLVFEGNHTESFKIIKK